MGSSLGIGFVREKKTKDMIVTLPEISDDLLMDILIRLPVKSLMRFKCVSKLWFSLISSRYLTNLFLKNSPRSRFYSYFVDQDKQRYALLTSNHYHHSETSLSVTIDQDITMPLIGGGYFVSSVRGLVCFKNGRRVRICNLNTRQVVELPLLEGNYNDENLWIYFGYEHVNDEYKVLSTIWDEERGVRSEHHVLSLGPGASWKKTRNHIPHRPYRPHSEGITINSVLYYEARTDNSKRCVLMSFDFNSEEFKQIELPINVDNFVSLFCIDLMNYKGKVAVFRYMDVQMSKGILEIWVLEEDAEDKSQWSEKTFVLPVSQMNWFQRDQLTMGGRVQIWLQKSYYFGSHLVYFYIYDLERKEITRRIETRKLLGSFPMPYLWMATSWDDIESIMYLET